MTDCQLVLRATFSVLRIFQIQIQHETMPTATVFEFDMQSYSSLSFSFAGYFLISISRATHWLRLDNIDHSRIQMQCL